MCDAWESKEMQMFDLVEELNQNFYDYLGISQDASSAEIKKSYRKLSVKFHPDKNKDDPNAHEKFRMLVGVYDVLKDDEMRKHTSLKRHRAKDRKLEAIEKEILESLNVYPYPRWKDLLPFSICKHAYFMATIIPVLIKVIKDFTVFKFKEYRKLRKEMKELEQVRKQRIEKKERKQRDSIHKKSSNDLYSKEDAVVSNFVFSDLPTITEDTISKMSSESVLDSEWSEADLINLVHAFAKYPGGVSNRWGKIAQSLNRTVPAVVAKVKSLDEKELRKLSQTSFIPEYIPTFETNLNAVCGDSDSDNDYDEDLSGNESDIVLIRRRKKHNRDYIYKQQDENLEEENRNVESSLDVGNKQDEIDECLTSNVVSDEIYMSRKKLKLQKAADIQKSKKSALQTLLSDGWSQAEQNQLEVAIRSILKGTPDRWDRIAECVPSKTKMEIMVRVKLLSSLTKKKE